MSPGEILPLAQEWVEECMERALTSGITLGKTDKEIAVAAGVEKVGAVRVLHLFELPIPEKLKSVAESIGFGSAVGGLTAGHGIIMVNDDMRTMAHELKHVAQYERCGGIRPFLELYIKQVLAFGYDEAPLEKEAREFGEKYD